MKNGKLLRCAPEMTRIDRTAWNLPASRRGTPNEQGASKGERSRLALRIFQDPVSARLQNSAIRLCCNKSPLSSNCVKYAGPRSGPGKKENEMANGKKSWVRFEIRPEDMEVVKIDLVPPREIEEAALPAGMVTVKIAPPIPANEPGEFRVILTQAEVFVEAEEGGISCADWALPNSAGQLVKVFAENAVQSSHAEWIAAAVAKVRSIEGGENVETREADGSEVVEEVGVTD